MPAISRLCGRGARVNLEESGAHFSMAAAHFEDFLEICEIVLYIAYGGYFNLCKLFRKGFINGNVVADVISFSKSRHKSGVFTNCLSTPLQMDPSV